MRKLKDDNIGSAVPLILFFLVIFGAGALYTLFFTEFALPFVDGLVPSSDSKTFIFMIIYALPMIILVIGVFSLLKEGLKRSIYGG
jgi:hypothetical protein